MATGMLEIIFPKKNLKYEFLNNLYFGPKFIFYGHLLGFLASFCFVDFCRWSTINFIHNVGYKNPDTKIYIEDNLKEKT